MVKYSVDMYNGKEYITKHTDDLISAYGMAEKYVASGKDNTAKISVSNNLITYVYKDYFTGKLCKSHTGNGYMVQCNDSYPLKKVTSITQARIVACKIPVSLVCIDKINSRSENGYDEVGLIVRYRGSFEWHEKNKPIKRVNPSTGRLIN